MGLFSLLSSLCRLPPSSRRLSICHRWFSLSQHSSALAVRQSQPPRISLSRFSPAAAGAPSSLYSCTRVVSPLSCGLRRRCSSLATAPIVHSLFDLFLLGVSQRHRCLLPAVVAAGVPLSQKSALTESRRRLLLTIARRSRHPVQPLLLLRELSLSRRSSTPSAAAAVQESSSSRAMPSSGQPAAFRSALHCHGPATAVGCSHTLLLSEQAARFSCETEIDVKRMGLLLAENSQLALSCFGEK